MSTPLVSVVVPTKNAGRTLARCLDSVRSQTHPQVELIVVDNHSTDDTVAIAGCYADWVEHHGPERSAQRNLGWRLSQGEILAFVDADMVLESALLADVVSEFQGDTAMGAVVLPELSFGEGFLARCRALEKRLYFGDPRVEAARAFRRDALQRVGGYAVEVTGFEDWELPDRVAAAGYRIGRTRSLVWHDEGRIDLRRQFAKKRYYGRWLSAYRNGDGLAPARPLTRTALLTHPSLLARMPHRTAGLALLKTVEWAGLALGAVEGRRAGVR